MDPPFMENTSTVLPRLNVSLSHPHLKTKKMHKHSTLVYTSEQTFAIPGEEGCVPLLHNPPWT